MSKQTEPTPQIIHIMADGAVRDSIDGVIVAVNEATKPAYQVLTELAKKKIEGVA
jgi:hypothetical protein